MKFDLESLGIKAVTVSYSTVYDCITVVAVKSEMLEEVEEFLKDIPGLRWSIYPGNHYTLKIFGGFGSKAPLAEQLARAAESEGYTVARYMGVFDEGHRCEKVHSFIKKKTFVEKLTSLFSGDK